MVLDLLENFGKYVALNPFFPLVEAFIRDNKLEQLAPGSYNIKGEDVLLKIEMANGNVWLGITRITTFGRLFCRKRLIVLP